LTSCGPVRFSGMTVLHGVSWLVSWLVSSLVSWLVRWLVG